jgi:hypothetical protein
MRTMTAYSLAPRAKLPTRIGWLAVILTCLVFSVHGVRRERSILHSHDLLPLYSGARCLIHSCDAYKSSAILTQYHSAGGSYFDPDAWQDANCIYPPTAFLEMLPFALLSWPAMHLLWPILTALAICAAAFLCADLCTLSGSGLAALAAMLAICWAIYTETAGIIALGNSVAFAVLFLAIAAWCVLRERHLWPGAIALALSLGLKPQLGIFILLWILLQPRFPRRLAIRAIAVAVVLGIAALILVFANPAMRAWNAELRSNLALSQLPGAGLDPSPLNYRSATMTNLQAFFSAAFGHALPFVVIAIASALLILLYLAWRRHRTQPANIVALAALTTLTLVPFYHREYDTILLLLATPAIAALAARSRAWGSAAFALFIATLFAQSYKGVTLISHLRLGPLAMRPSPIATLLLCCFFTAALAFVSRRHSERA